MKDNLEVPSIFKLADPKTLPNLYHGIGSISVGDSGEEYRLGIAVNYAVIYLFAPQAHPVDGSDGQIWQCDMRAFASAVVNGHIDIGKARAFKPLSVIEGLPEWSVEDSGAARIGEIGGDSDLFVRVQSYDTDAVHPVTGDLDGRRLRVTIEVEDNG